MGHIYIRVKSGKWKAELKFFIKEANPLDQQTTLLSTLTERKWKRLASIQKLNASGIGLVFKHNNRTPNDNVEHSNKDIDNERTKFNYHLKRGTTKDVSKRIDEVYSVNRKNTVVLAEAVVTMPSQIKEDDERDFFQAVYDFYAEDFGEENIINAVVHKDESSTRPHIHIDIVPVKKENIVFNENSKLSRSLEKWKEENGISKDEEFERLCAKEVVNKSYLNTMHNKLNEFVSERLGYEAGIINGATANGNLTVQQLKAKRAQEEKERLEKEIEELKTEINNIHKIMTNCGIGEESLSLLPLLCEIENLKKKNTTLENIIMRNRCSYTNEDLEAMKAKTIYRESNVSKINIYEGSLTQLAIDDYSVVIFDIPDTVDRPLPQAKLFERSPDLRVQLSFAQRIREKVVVRDSRIENRKYIFVKSDNDRMMIDRIIELGKAVKEILKKEKRKVYMDKLEFDKYDFAKSVLMNAGADICYCTRYQLEEIKDEEKEAKKQVEQFM